jgi:hypothetical protein
MASECYYFSGSMVTLIPTLYGVKCLKMHEPVLDGAKDVAFSVISHE